MSSSDADSSVDEEYSEDEETTGSTKYAGGRILSIKLSNFMTYDHTTLNPGPGLNLIIGPNGTGKSTTVCAICLGLGGKPCFAGRQMHLKDFVKHGKKKASVEITLDDPSKKRNLVIRRVIRNDGASRYAINGKEVKEYEVLKEVKRFNIQTNNLCQFLPQERVSEFSKMKPVQLLESMQQAVGNADLFKHHDDLKKFRDKSRKIEESISNIENVVTSQKNQNKQSASEAKMFEDRKEMETKLELLQEFLPLMQYKESHREYKEKKAQKQEADEKLKTIKKKLEPLSQRVKKIDAEIEECNKKSRDGKDAFKKHLGKVKQGSEKISSLMNQMESSGSQLQQKIDDQKKIAERMKAIKSQINSMVVDLENNNQLLAGMEIEQSELSVKIEKIEQDISNYDFQLDDIKSTKEKYTAEKRGYEVELQKVNSIENRKLNVLKQRDLDAFNAVIWLKDNQYLFKQQIFNPILMEIKIPDQNHIKFIENHIMWRDLAAFVCENKEDSKLLVEKLRGERGWAISAVVPPPSDLKSYTPPVSKEEMFARYRLKYYLKDLFTAPDPIMKFLCANYNVHKIPIGDAETERYIGAIRNDEKFGKFFTSDSFHTVKRSKYGNRLLTMSTVSLKPAHILNKFTDTTERQKELQNLIQNIDVKLNEEKRKEEALKVECQKLNKTLDCHRQKKKEYNNLRITIRNFEVQIRLKQSSLEQVKKDVKDVPTLIKEMEQRMNELKKQMIMEAKDRDKWCKAALKSRRQNLIYLLHETCLAEKHQEFSSSLQEDKNALEELNKEVKEIERECAKLQQQTKEFFKRAEIAVKMPLRGNQAIIEEKYGNLPHSLTDVQSEIHGIKAKLYLYGETSEQAYTAHLARQNDIEENEDKLESLQANLAKLKSSIEAKKDLWLKPLNILIEKINDTFSTYMQNLSCAGEVSLKVAENPDDFDKYGLSILVKFRDKTPLQELSHARHSGGECSVATIIFILALQKLTDVPFRCVDEINQGMDAINERRIFELVSMSSGNSSQYFLLTPKLLPDLSYPDTIQLHVINNAPGLQDNMNWNFDNLCCNIERKAS